MDRFFIMIAGLFGASGVAASAAGSHEGQTNLLIAGGFLLLHAVALLAIAGLKAGRAATVASLILALGTALFAGDLALRAQTGSALFPMAAPIGGGLLILGWLAVIGLGIWNRRA